MHYCDSLQKFNLGLIWTGENGFANFFVFVKIFHREDNWLQSLINDYEDMQIFHFYVFIATGFVNTPKCLF